MRRRALLCLGPALAAAAPWLHAQHVGAERSAELVGLKRQGEARLRFFGMHIYDIRLWSSERVTATDWPNQQFVLELQYARHLRGREIAERSLKEMRRQGEITEAQAQNWLAQMQEAFPDVDDGDRLSGLHEAGSAAVFYLNGQWRRRIADARFAKLFFGIWLSAQSSEPALRAKLLVPDERR